jgi:hypothetical protein
MDITVLVQDCTLQGALLKSLALPLPAVELTARALIRRYVQQVVDEQNSAPAPSRYSFFAPTADEALLNAHAQAEKPLIDAQRHAQLALRAFESNRFLLLVDDRQIEHLDETFSITPISTIQFLRLVPLIGG